MVTLELDVELLTNHVIAHPEALLGDDDASLFSEVHSKVISIGDIHSGTLTNHVMRLKLKRLAMRGVQATEAAGLVGWTPEYVRRLYKDPDFRREVLNATNAAFDDVDAQFQEDQKTLVERMEEASETAFEVLYSALKTDTIAGQTINTNQKIKIAQDLLDRGETTSVKKTNISKKVLPQAVQDPETLARAIQTAREMDEARTKRIRRIS